MKKLFLRSEFNAETVAPVTRKYNFSYVKSRVEPRLKVYLSLSLKLKNLTKGSAKNLG